MSIHINAPAGAVAETILLPGDPLRAKFIAETYLQDVVCYNEYVACWGSLERTRGDVFRCKAQAWESRRSQFTQAN